MNPGIAGVADPHDAAVLDPDIGFDDALHGVKDQRVGDDEIERLGVQCRAAIDPCRRE